MQCSNFILKFQFSSCKADPFVLVNYFIVIVAVAVVVIVIFVVYRNCFYLSMFTKCKTETANMDDNKNVAEIFMNTELTR